MDDHTLEEIADQQPYPDYLPWWPMGEEFLTFMSTAIVDEWSQIGFTAQGDVEAYVARYIETIYGATMRSGLVENFVQRTALATIRSGEFDALSYGFYRSAFEILAERGQDNDQLAFERHEFCRRVGKSVFSALEEHLGLRLPHGAATAGDLTQVKLSLDTIGGFLKQQGYLRDHFAFRFDVQAEHGGQAIDQTEDDFLQRILDGETGYAFYEMGYPAILPSAVYLYHTMGEAQHHSSRIIEDFFGAIGYVASETDDFDPTGFPSDMVVELWEIQGAT